MRKSQNSPPAAPAERVTFFEANDMDGTVAPVTRELALPQEPGARARVLLRQLFADYAAPDSKHPLTAGPGVEEVFFTPAAGGKPSPSTVDSGPKLRSLT